MTVTQKKVESTEYVATFAGEGIAIDPITSQFGYVELPEVPTLTGFVFEGWSDGTNVYGAGESVKIAQDTTFTAVWTEGIAVKATFTGVGAENVDDIYADGEGNIVLPEALADTNLHFVGWSDGVTTYDAGAEVVINADTEFTAVWREFALSFTGVGAAETIVATEGNVVLPENTANNGTSVFMGWKINSTVYAAGATVAITADTVAEAVWQGSIYTTGVANGVLTTNYDFDQLRNGANLDLACPNGGNAEGFSTKGNYYFSLSKAAYWYDYLPLDNTANNLNISFQIYVQELLDEDYQTISIGDTIIYKLDKSNAVRYNRYTLNIEVNFANGTVTVNGGDPIEVDLSDAIANNKLLIRYDVTNGGRLYDLTATQEVVKKIWVDGHQQTDVNGGTYNVRFIAGVGELVAGQSAVGFEISTTADGGKSWTKQTSTVYESISANYGADTLLATEVPNASYLTALAITGVPAELGEVTFVITPYVIIAGEKVYGDAATITVTPRYPAE